MQMHALELRVFSVQCVCSKNLVYPEGNPMGFKQYFKGFMILAYFEKKLPESYCKQAF
jgi:hypothetical protein